MTNKALEPMMIESIDEFKDSILGCIKEFRNEVVGTQKEMRATITEINKVILRIKTDVSKNLKDSLNLAKQSNARIKEHDDVLKDVKNSSENAEETLLNVLLAIRQNEYLQAWYPPQKGHPAMKVVGKHPMNQKAG